MSAAPTLGPPAAFFDLFKLGVLLIATYQFNVDSGEFEGGSSSMPRLALEGVAAVCSTHVSIEHGGPPLSPVPAPPPSPPPPPPCTAAAFLLAVKDLAGSSPSGLGTVDTAVEAANTLKVMAALRKMADLLQVSPSLAVWLRVRGDWVELAGASTATPFCLPSRVPTWALLAHCCPPGALQEKAQEKQQQQGGGGGGGDSTGMLQDLAAYLTLEKAQVLSCRRAGCCGGRRQGVEGWSAAPCACFNLASSDAAG